MTESNRPTAYGLSILDIATANVLRAFEMSDWHGALIRMRILVGVTGDQELVELVSKHTKDIMDYQVQFRARKEGITTAENVATDSQLQSYVREQSLKLFETIFLKMKVKKITTQNISPVYGVEGKM